MVRDTRDPPEFAGMTHEQFIAWLAEQERRDGHVRALIFVVFALFTVAIVLLVVPLL